MENIENPTENIVENPSEKLMEHAVDYEQLSYGKLFYKQVKRLRKKGKRRGIEVPYLNYELTKPEKPRTIFTIIAIVSLVFLIAAFVGCGFLYNELAKSMPYLTGAGDVFKLAKDPAAFALTAGLSTLPAMIVILAYLMLFCIFLIPILFVIYIIHFVRETLYMAKCSKEEFAKGHMITRKVFNLSAILVVATIALVVVLLKSSSKLTISLIVVMYIIALLAFGGLLTPIVIEKVKCKKWFNEQLEEEKRKNYLEHDTGLRRVKRRIDSERVYWSNLGR